MPSAQPNNELAPIIATTRLIVSEKAGSQFRRDVSDEHPGTSGPSNLFRSRRMNLLPLLRVAILSGFKGVETNPFPKIKNLGLRFLISS
jgi:hypothetical protein